MLYHSEVLMIVYISPLRDGRQGCQETCMITKTNTSTVFGLVACVTATKASGKRDHLINCNTKSELTIGNDYFVANRRCISVVQQKVVSCSNKSNC